MDGIKFLPDKKILFRLSDKNRNNKDGPQNGRSEKESEGFEIEKEGKRNG
ncbi:MULTISPECIES: hypothetical protein [unclassified Blautia]